MKVIVWFIDEGKKEYKFNKKEELDDFVNVCRAVGAMQGGIRRITIRY